MTNTTLLNIFITNLRAYNEGELLGEWVELPQDPDDLQEIIDRISNDEEDEYFITDYESNIGIKCDEYENIFDLNEQVQEIADAAEPDIIAAYLEAVDGNVERAIDAADDCILYSDCDSLEDLAYRLVDEGCYGEIPDSLRNYIDYEAIARDLGFDNYYETTYGVLYAG
jgi:antirestriction protein